MVCVHLFVHRIKIGKYARCDFVVDVVREYSFVLSVIFVFVKE